MVAVALVCLGLVAPHHVESSWARDGTCDSVLAGGLPTTGSPEKPDMSS